MPSYYEMVSKALLDGLRRARFDVEKLAATQVNAGFFSDSADVQTANATVRSIVTRLKIRAGRGERLTQQGLERDVALMAAESAFQHAVLGIRLSLATRDNISKDVRDARDALSVLENYEDSGARVHRSTLKELIGEE